MSTVVVNDPRSDESQASQLLAAALRPRELQPAATTSFHVGECHSRDGSLQSSNSNSVHYHMLGLVATQTQSPYTTQDQKYPEGSQKENNSVFCHKDTRSPPLNSFLGDTPSCLQLGSFTEQGQETPPGIMSKERPWPKDVGAQINDLQSSIKGDKAVSFALPSRPASLPQTHIDRPSTLPSHPAPPLPKPRSLSPVSQDSFAGPLPVPDLARAFLARAKNFTIPLSQLGEESQSQSVSDADGPPPVAPSNMRTNPRPEAAPHPHPSSPTEKVLVAGTPSNSSHDSQSQSHTNPFQHAHIADDSQERRNSQPYDFSPRAQSQTHDIDYSMYAHQPTQENEDGTITTPPSPRDVSTEPSSSYERLLKQDPFANVPEATQLADETAPTQIVELSTQATGSSNAFSVVQHHDFYNDHGQMVFPSARSEDRSEHRASDISRDTVPQKFRGLVAPDKWHRYKDIVPGPSAQRNVRKTQSTVSDGPSSPFAVETQPTLLVETQPSDVAVRGSAPSPSPSPQRGLPPANQVLARRGLRTPMSVSSSHMNVVPDSEGMGPTQAVPELEFSPTRRRALLSPSSVQTHDTPIKGRKGALQSEDEVSRAIAAEPTLLAVQEEGGRDDDDDDDDDDVPLVAAVRSAKAQGKQRAVVPVDESFVLPSPPAERRRGAQAPQSATKGGIIRRTTLIQRSSSWKDAVIPSSDPRERHEELEQAEKAPARSGKARNPAKQVPPRPRSAPRAAKLAAREHLHESSTEEDDNEQTDESESLRADQGDMDVDPPEPQTKTTRGSKRKRAVSSSSKRAPPKAGPKAVKKEPSPLPTRPAKRLKSSSSAQVDNIGAPTRVFALWKNTAKYYPGVVQQALDPTRYLVRFDDADEAEVELKHIRACRLQDGDQVLVAQKRKAKVVRALDSSEPGDTITIEYVHGECEEVTIQMIQIAARTAAVDWVDRVLSEDAIVPVIKPKPAHMSPTPSRLSLPSEGSARGVARRLLAKTGMVVTLSPKLSGWEHQKDELMANIKKLGGVVLDDWACIFDMDGKIEQKGMRWILSQDDIQWKNRADIDRVFLISDDHHQKPKFLIALALGIPCLSIEWLKDVVAEEDKDWPPYLLPAGFSERLSARVSQMVDLDWGNSSQYLNNVTDNLVAAKVFAHKSLLCISPDFVPSRQKSKKTNHGAPRKEAAEAVPRIVLCMGAAAVEAVPDAKHASQNLHVYDYVVVRDESDFSRYPDLEHCVNVGWVKDCLISGRLLPLPNGEDD